MKLAGVDPNRKMLADVAVHDEAAFTQLVATAKRLFGQRGYQATTMGDIATAAGVTKPLLYQHFTSKRALYLELVDRVSSELLDGLRSTYQRSSGPREMVEKGFGAYFELIITHEDAFRLLFGRHAPDDPELLSALRQVESAVLDVLQSNMAANLGPDHRRLLAHAIVGLADGGTRFWVEQNDRAVATAAGGDDKVVSSPDDVRRLAERVSTIAWAGLRGVQPD